MGRNEQIQWPFVCVMLWLVLVMRMSMLCIYIFGVGLSEYSVCAGGFAKDRGRKGFMYVLGPYFMAGMGLSSSICCPVREEHLGTTDEDDGH